MKELNKVEAPLGVFVCVCKCVCVALCGVWNLLVNEIFKRLRQRNIFCMRL